MDKREREIREAVSDDSVWVGGLAQEEGQYLLSLLDKERERTSRLEEALREEHARIHPNPKRWEPGLGPNVCDVCAFIYWSNPTALESESRE
jgi:hypothetical protein